MRWAPGGTDIKVRMKQSRTYQWAEVVRYVNRATKGRMDVKERELFFRNAESAWRNLAAAMTPEQRLIFLKKVGYAFRNYSRPLPTWNPKVDEDGQIIKPQTPYDVLSGLVMSERARQIMQAKNPDVTADAINNEAGRLLILYIEWQKALAEQCAKIEVSRATDFGDKIVWNIKYPDGHSTTFTTDGKVGAEVPGAIAARNWSLWSRIEPLESGERIRFSTVEVAEVHRRMQAGETDEAIMDGLMLFPEDLEAVRLWMEETT